MSKESHGSQSLPWATAGFGDRLHAPMVDSLKTIAPLALPLVAGTLWACAGDGRQTSDTTPKDSGVHAGDGGDGDEASGEDAADSADEAGLDDGFDDGGEGDGDADEEADDDDDDDDDSGDGGDPPKWDLGGLPDYDPIPSSGCAKVDFLFVIDNSGSMMDEQQNLLRNFPGFMASIRDTLMVSDFHVMAVDTDEMSATFPPACNRGECFCFGGGNVGDCCGTACRDPANTTCNDMPCADWPDPGCRTVLGAGVKENAVNGTDCMFVDDKRYITRKQDDANAAFVCAAEMGIEGNGDERPLEAMVAAVSDQQNDAGGCNEGFVRDDAILVVTIITDEEDNGKSAGNPASWKQALVEAKGGNEEAVVVLGLIGDRDLPNPICSEPDPDSGTGAEASPNLREFVRSFGDKGLDASICADDYRPFFEMAVGIVDDTCDSFDPETR